MEDDNFFEFESLKITDALSKYFDKNKTTDYSLFGNAAKEFRNTLCSILFTAISKFEKEKECLLTNKDILIVNGDAEHILGNQREYFKEWAYTINSVIWLGIEEFYNKMVEKGYSYENLPLIIPIILFPSSEILVASSMDDFNKVNYRSFNAKPALKQKVYDTESIGEAITSGRLQEVLDTFVVPESLSKIYSDLPEVRKMLHILTFK